MGLIEIRIIQTSNGLASFPRYGVNRKIIPQTAILFYIFMKKETNMEKHLIELLCFIIGHRKSHHISCDIPESSDEKGNAIYHLDVCKRCGNIFKAYK